MFAQFVLSPKGEFETSEQFQARRGALPVGKFAFMLATEEVRYDADSQAFRIVLEGDSAEHGGTLVHALPLHTARKELGSYTGQNAFGVKANVTRVGYAKHMLIRRGDDILDAAPQLSVSVPLADAAAVKPLLRIMAIAVLDEGSVTPAEDPDVGPATGFAHYDAEIDSPYDTTYLYYSVDSPSIEFWVYNFATGAILSRFDSEGAEIRVGQKAAAPDVDSLRDGDNVAPVVIETVEPEYPAVARKARVAGVVIVEALVGVDGRVKDTKVLKPLPFGLDQAAVDAVKKYRFNPATRGGAPVEARQNVMVTFKLD